MRMTSRWPWISSSQWSRKKENPCENTLRDFVISLICPAGMPLPMLLQTCRHNFLDRVKVHIGAIKAHIWKKLIEQTEIAKKLVKKFEFSVPKNKWGSALRGVMQPNLPNPKGKKWWQLSRLEKLHQSRRGAAPATIKNSRFHRDNIPSKMNRWWQFFTYLIKVTTSSYLESGGLKKWGIQMTPTTVSYTEWCIIPPADALFSRTRSKH